MDDVISTFFLRGNSRVRLSFHSEHDYACSNSMWLAKKNRHVLLDLHAYLSNKNEPCFRAELVNCNRILSRKKE